MKKEERRAYMRALHEKEHPERTYYTRKEWLLRKAAEKSTADSHSDQLKRIERNYNSAVFFSVIAIVLSIITIVLSISTLLRLLPQLLQQL